MIPSRLAMLRFELGTATPRALGILRAGLGAGELARALGGYALRSLRDPFAALGPPSGPAEAFTRRQLAPVLALDEALRLDAGLDAERASALLQRIVSESGAEFLRFNLELPTAERWATLPLPEREGLVSRLLSRFPNAESRLGHLDDAGLEFDVHACWFAELARRLDRPQLAALYCEADARFFGDPAVGITLTRPHTLARGGPTCAFRLRFRPGAASKL